MPEREASSPQDPVGAHERSSRQVRGCDGVESRSGTGIRHGRGVDRCGVLGRRLGDGDVARTGRRGRRRGGLPRRRARGADSAAAGWARAAAPVRTQPPSSHVPAWQRVPVRQVPPDRRRVQPACRRARPTSSSPSAPSTSSTPWPPSSPGSRRWPCRLGGRGGARRTTCERPARPRPARRPAGRRLPAHRLGQLLAARTVDRGRRLLAA